MNKIKLSNKSGKKFPQNSILDNPTVLISRQHSCTVSDAEIIAVSTIIEKMPENNEDVNVEDTIQTPKISHNERLKAVETSLQYFEQQGASVMDLLSLRCPYDEAA
ncbi:hypothetical protein TNCV_4862611 [Trichonephila clavipes]|nr:hypothetical protein TNCV_4862611 [Trichonephila clavipes]